MSQRTEQGTPDGAKREKVMVAMIETVSDATKDRKGQIRKALGEVYEALGRLLALLEEEDA